MATKSRTEANAETSVEGEPEASTKGVMLTAAERVRLEPCVVLRSAWSVARRLAVSSEETTLQPTPCLFGYSQLRDRVSEKKLGRTKGVYVLKVDAIKLILVDEVRNYIHKGRAVGFVT